jgi:uncharacterized protein
VCHCLVRGPGTVVVVSDSAPGTLFAPEGGTWHGLSPRYVVVRRLTVLLTNVVFWVIVAVVSWLALERTIVTGAAATAGAAWTLWRVYRAKAWVESWGWSERDADLCIRHGLWTRHLSVVPFGRMQLVDISAGPVLRSQGLANVQLVTAAAHTEATIPGLAHADAVALRDRMIQLSDAGGAGL